MSPRHAIKPPYPDSPGSWLAAFRYRARTESGAPLTADDLGAFIGVSGATARRWELGSSKPSLSDLRAVAEAIHLSASEAAFLVSAFFSRGLEDPPSPDVFDRLTGMLLETSKPAVIRDSLLFLRARNSYASLITNGPDLDVAPHIFHAMAAAVASSTNESQRASREAAYDRWLYEFWSSTARLCGSEPYRLLLQKLVLIPGFIERWQELALEERTPANELIGGPYISDRGANGLYRVLQVRATTPALYFYIEYVPEDAAAQRAVDQVQAHGPPTLVTTPYRHWSLDPYLWETQPGGAAMHRGNGRLSSTQRAMD